jgi:rhodanese-related sulfurtransferase
MVSGQKFHWPMGSAANKHGRVIGDNLVGRQTVFTGVVGTAVLKVLNYNVGKTGLTEKQARDLGYEVVTTLAPSPDCSHFYPANKVILLKLVADAKTGKLLGAQAVGPGEAVKRIDVLATALRFGATISEIGQLDLGYAPPYSTAIDLASHAANIIENKLAGLAKAISPLEVKAKLEQGDDFVWLDVRSPQEFEQIHIENRRVKLIPLGKLRERIEELPKDKEIVVFCKVSLRGYEAQRILEGAGLTNVKFMDGGIVAWPYELANLEQTKVQGDNAIKITSPTTDGQTAKAR